MEKLRWLGRCRELELDILSVFQLKITDYCNTGKGIYEEETRLKQDIDKVYTYYKTHLNPQSLAIYPTEFQQIAQTLEQKLDHTYALLTDSTKYQTPGSNGDILQFQFGSCTLIDYMRWLETIKYPNIPSFTDTLIQFLALKFCFANYQQLTNKQLTAKDETIAELRTENNILQKTITSIEETLGAIEFRSSVS